MSIILAIETSTQIASIALRIDGHTRSRDKIGTQGHSEWLLPAIQSLLEEADISLKRCDALAFGAGPGSFTGVRMACGIVQGLAFGSGLPVAPVNTLLATAFACHAEIGTRDVLVILDARMAEVYWAQYRFDIDGWTVITEPRLSVPSSVIAQGPVVVCGDGLTVCADVFAATGFDSVMEVASIPRASEIALLGERMLGAGTTVSACDAQPVYLRNQVALTTAERVAKAAGLTGVNP